MPETESEQRYATECIIEDLEAISRVLTEQVAVCRVCSQASARLREYHKALNAIVDMASDEPDEMPSSYIVPYIAGMAVGARLAQRAINGK